MTEDGPTYEEYLELSKRQREDDRARFEGRLGDGWARFDLRTGHLFDVPFPPTGNEAYDRLRPMRQAYTPAAMEGAGFDLRALERYRSVLQADPYGPREHRVREDGAIEPVLPGEES